MKEYVVNIEEFGYFNGEYVKLSTGITRAIENDVKRYIENTSKAEEETIKQIVESKYLYYSKKLHGDIMLRNINPDILVEKCRKYFKESYYQIKNVVNNDIQE